MRGEIRWEIKWEIRWEIRWKTRWEMRWDKSWDETKVDWWDEKRDETFAIFIFIFFFQLTEKLSFFQREPLLMVNVQTIQQHFSEKASFMNAMISNTAYSSEKHQKSSICFFYVLGQKWPFFNFFRTDFFMDS